LEAPLEAVLEVAMEVALKMAFEVALVVRRWWQGDAIVVQSGPAERTPRTLFTDWSNFKF
jgi:hypothetical protein